MPEARDPTERVSISRGADGRGPVGIGLFPWLWFSPSLALRAVRADWRNVLEQLWVLQSALAYRALCASGWCTGSTGLSSCRSSQASEPTGPRGRSRPVEAPCVPCLPRAVLCRSPQLTWGEEEPASGGPSSSCNSPMSGPGCYRGPCPLTGHTTHASCQAWPTCPGSSPAGEWFSFIKTSNF